jgi:hypothetical protein
MPNDQDSRRLGYRLGDLTEGQSPSVGCFQQNVADSDMAQFAEGDLRGHRPRFGRRHWPLQAIRVETLHSVSAEISAPAFRSLCFLLFKAGLRWAG